MGYKRIRNGNKHAFMLCILDNEAEGKAGRNMEEKPEQVAEREDNKQVFRFEEDLFNMSREGGLPF